MTCEDIVRCLWHLQVPVCRTLRGVKTHLRLIGLADVQLLVRYFSCSADDLVARFWCCVKTPWPTEGDCRNCNDKVGGCRMDGNCETPTDLETAAHNRLANAG